MSQPDVTPHASPYDEAFYQEQMGGSYQAAQKYVRLLARHMAPQSVVDLGCGRGTWLRAFAEAGAQRLVGIDGPWNRRENMVDERIDLYQMDLAQPVRLPNEERFDLAISLEVAEHLPPAAARTFVSSLTGFADLVIFGAAYTRQGGTDHFNEQPNSYWAAYFEAEGYVPFDLFRPAVWGDPEVPFWYQQNAFLYARHGSTAYAELLSSGASKLANRAFMDCVHPDLYQIKLQMLEAMEATPPFRESLGQLSRSLSEAVQRRLK